LILDIVLFSPEAIRGFFLGSRESGTFHFSLFIFHFSFFIFHFSFFID